jgi:hypothetical protein
VFFQSYPYLVFSLFVIFVLAVLWLLYPRQRLPLLVGGLFASPQALASIELVPEYWNPEYVIELPWKIGVEDVLFNFYMGGVAWLLATCFVVGRLEVKFTLSTVISRYLYAVLFGSAIGIPLYLMGVRPIDIAFVVFGLWTVALLSFRPSLWPLAVSGLFLGAVYAAVGYRLNLLLWPRISDYFNWQALWGVSFGRIPLEEYLYFALFCPAWALTTAVMLDARIRPSDRGEVS